MKGDDPLQVWVLDHQTSMQQLYAKIYHNNTITSIVLQKVNTK
jgi:hypothetical protein